MRRGLSGINLAALTLGFAFLYIPILLLIIYSFNESKLVTVWAGFSTKWYVAMVENTRLLDAAWMTLKVAVVSSTVALVLGTLAGLALARLGRFPGRTLFSGMVYAPLVMPEVITGLSMLLLFVALSWSRGYWTVTVAHITFSMAYVAVVVQSRLLTMDRSLEEAAMDLGAPPVKTFFAVTLPIISPALVAGWLLAFTLSARRSGDRVVHQRPGLDDAADEDLLAGALGRDAGDQRGLHGAGGGRLHRRDRRESHQQARHGHPRGGRHRPRRNGCGPCPHNLSRSAP